jgi:pyruvate,water dikinase
MEDIFYLTIDDLNLLKTKTNSKIIQKRKNQSESYKALSMPRRIESQSGDINLHNYRIAIKGNNSIGLKGTIASTGMNNGIISGTALVLNSFDPKGQYSGKILVTQQTDPGWTIIFPMLKGIIVERGGMLSHAAIISREFGIPCIMGVEHATTRVKNGQKISIDIKKSCVYTT